MRYRVKNSGMFEINVSCGTWYERDKSKVVQVHVIFKVHNCSVFLASDDVFCIEKKVLPLWQRKIQNHCSFKTPSDAVSNMAFNIITWYFRPTFFDHEIMLHAIWEVFREEVFKLRSLWIFIYHNNHKIFVWAANLNLLIYKF